MLHLYGISGGLISPRNLSWGLLILKNKKQTNKTKPKTKTKKIKKTLKKPHKNKQKTTYF